MVEAGLGDIVQIEGGGWWEVVASLKTAKLHLVRVGLSKPPAQYLQARWKTSIKGTDHE